MTVQYSDPFLAWKKIYDEWEPQAAEAWNTLLTSETYSIVSAQMMQAFLQINQLVSQTMKSVAEKSHLPSIDDVARLGEMVAAVDEKIDAIDERLIRVEETLKKMQEALESRTRLGQGSRGRRTASRDESPEDREVSGDAPSSGGEE
ncbi:DUF4349 domain-containing protein [Kyrpidia tusciae]|uniref:Poly(3-hydroxyalkanoate) polymerase subunit PhaE n=1 Tax=Kyrpidia tusciae (strain DSM 2912 / NBRC 15312 / T2) TaxID=562970 RepID=D5WPP0_KYRT2|nr:hypothetical protein [Kyrpidia tusciae]ADG06299.1 hypothetical protein Btus_1589 [Kyrpidia tusciae DSM 2912]